MPPALLRSRYEPNSPALLQSEAWLPRQGLPSVHRPLRRAMGTKPACILAVSLSLLTSAAAVAEPPKWETVYGLATVNGRTKKVGDRTYALIALYFDPLVQILGT